LVCVCEGISHYANGAATQSDPAFVTGGAGSAIVKENDIWIARNRRITGFQERRDGHIVMDKRQAAE
jgi:hypothetical protein